MNNIKVSNTEINKEIKLNENKQNTNKPNIDKSNNETNSNKKLNNRCFFCNKKLKLHLIYSCKCNNIFCSKHRYYHTHNCIYDNKQKQIDNLKNNNPLIIHEKLIKIN